MRHALLLLGFCTACTGSYRSYTEWVVRASHNETLLRDFQKYLPLFEIDKQAQKSIFPCEPFTPSATIPTSVHRLRPGDVQVVAALGDSITAGNGVTAATIIGVLRQDRGLSWSIGGDGDFEYQPTIPNILRKYNPELRGFSVKSGDEDSRNSHLNVAVPGAKAEDLVEQAERLISKFETEPGVNLTTDWKVVTIFIGGNDLCDYCEDTAYYNASAYVLRVQRGLDILHQKLPRAFVNLVAVNHVDELHKVNTGLVCTISHVFECECGAYPGSQAALDHLRHVTEEYNAGLMKLAKSGRYDTRDDFTVVMQPFFSNTMIPLKEHRKPDLSYLAPDCFHLSRKGHAAAAIALWNNMIHPEDSKRTRWVPGQTPDCPNEDNPYLSTYTNSGSTRRLTNGGLSFSLHVSFG